MKKKAKNPLLILLGDEERSIVEFYSEQWGMALAAVIRRMIREYHEAKTREGQDDG